MAGKENTMATLTVKNIRYLYKLRDWAKANENKARERKQAREVEAAKIERRSDEPTEELAKIRRLQAGAEEQWLMYLNYRLALGIVLADLPNPDGQPTLFDGDARRGEEEASEEGSGSIIDCEYTVTDDAPQPAGPEAGGAEGRGGGGEESP